MAENMETKIKNLHQYDDIIHLPHPVSDKHSRMTVEERAAQFAPFAALTGYHEAIEETVQKRIRKLEQTQGRDEKMV